MNDENITNELAIKAATILGQENVHELPIRLTSEDFAYYSQHPLDILKVYEGGLASHGGAIGIIIGMWLYCKKTQESWIWLFDRLVVVVPFASFMIRFGNLMNSEIVGKPTDVPWAFVFHQLDELPRHPTQLYEALFYICLFVLFYWLWKNKRHDVGKGFMFGLF
jgi:prolipoprotein diacylglyceryl transferase